MRVCPSNWIKALLIIATLLCETVAAWQATTRPSAPRTSIIQSERQQQPWPFIIASSSSGAGPRKTPVTITSLRATNAESSNRETPSSSSSTTTKKSKPVPIILLSGFLGTGKTTALKYLLENTQNTKIGVIVNDVASVNIDAKLVNSASASSNIEGLVELQNGCACCSLADELFFSVDKMMTDRQLDAIVVELSGVADPTVICNNWLMAPDYIQDAAVVSHVVTVLDAASFGTDFMTWDEARERAGWYVAAEGYSGGERKVSQLLAEQVEAADLILLNKIDLADNEEQIQVAQAVAQALNDKAVVKRVEYGKIEPDMVLGLHKNDPETSHKEEVCEDPYCTDASHNHSHSHATHDEEHSHSHNEHASEPCSDPDCTDASHSHSHEHNTDCNDPDCTDTSHSHSHSHATSTDQLGIVNFVYKASRPFDPVRIMEFLNRWPVPVKDTLDLGLLREAQSDGYEVGGSRVATAENSPFVGVLRSKGYCWFAPNKWSGANEDAWRHDTAMFWSHAGKSFSIHSVGKWWATLDKDSMKRYFDTNMQEYERIQREDFVTKEFGDRRNELVFIGTNLDEDKIRETLDSCLYTEEEMDKYRQQLDNYRSTIMTTSMNSGLFDVGSMEHTDAIDSQ